MVYPYPISDWTRAEPYPKADALPLTGWAWEFLRRAPRYQRNFDRFEALGRPERLAGWLAHRYWFGYPPPDPRAPTSGGWALPDWASPPMEVEPLDLLDAGEWDNPGRLAALRDEFRDPAKLTLTFDLTRSIEAQLERAAELLREGREALAARPFNPLDPERRTRAPLAQFPAYVRILDADAAGARVPEIAATLYPREEDSRATGYRVSAKVREALKAARRLRDGGYRGPVGLTRQTQHATQHIRAASKR